MPYWMELHCSKKQKAQCNNSRQVNVPMVLTRSASLGAINQAVTYLTKQGEKIGWKLVRNDWVCPECLKDD